MEDQRKHKSVQSDNWERAKVFATFLDAVAKLLDLALRR